MNDRTDWFAEAKYGLFIHYLYDMQNDASWKTSYGKSTSWDEAVLEFDAGRFARDAAQTGAKYVIFTMMQVLKYMIAPNETYERYTGYQPGESTSSRDLVEDLYTELHKYGIELMLYWTGDGPRQDEQASVGLGLDKAMSGEEMKINPLFMQRWTEVAREYGWRYGDRVAGWWVDGCYDWSGYDQESLGLLAEALREGNANRIIAFNPGIYSPVIGYSSHEDYTAGEVNHFEDVPSSRWIGGEQWHIASHLGNHWGGLGTKYPTEDLLEYVRSVNAKSGVVSLDVAVYRDGKIAEEQVEQLGHLKRMTWGE
ncbi:alpha-L-fucosidase [Paenibacillus eucommiae]|uniref:Glycoside hydrolase family 29 N-terminal domain-containing protein n=1 Tax=Paenibacillus eucommiae TaxID=1355755 RepID=A0ABS4ITT2_9BACL|nr:alpha-L-fucosidase [Paenibacillus eucommiae]MBP1990520.1 hypothetical protein [Paenibacillus eucommiae]